MGNNNPTAEELERLSAAQDKTTASTGKLDVATTKLTGSLKEHGQQTKYVLTTEEAFREEQSKLAKQIDETRRTIDVLTGGSLTSMEAAVGGVFEKFKVLGETIALLGSSTLRDLINPIGNSNLVLGQHSEVLGAAEKVMSALATAQTTSRAASTMFGESIVKSNEAARLYPQNMRVAAYTTALTTQTIDNMNKTMREVPHAFDAIGTSVEGVTDLVLQNTMASAVMATAYRGLGILSEDAARRGLNAWRDHNQEAGETIRQLGIMSAAQRATGLAGSIVVDQVEQISKSLGIYGQKSAVAAQMWTTFMTALQQSGVPINQVQGIVEQVSSSIAGMSIQHRAFIGMMSGMAQGRSALGGALQLELAMRTPEGLQRHLQGLTSTLSQFGGGRIITLQEAGTNPQLEAQFVVQRATLQKMTGIASTEQLNRILETMQKVETGGMSQLEGSRELGGLFTSGLNVQENELTVLKRMEQLMQVQIGQRFDRDIGGSQDALRGFGIEGTMMGRTGGMEETRRAIGTAGKSADIFGATMNTAGRGFGRAVSEAAMNFRDIIGRGPSLRTIEASAGFLGAAGAQIAGRTATPRVWATPAQAVRLPREPQPTVLPERFRRSEGQPEGAVLPEAFRRPERQPEGAVSRETMRGLEEGRRLAETREEAVFSGMAEGQGGRQDQISELLAEFDREFRAMREAVPPAVAEGVGAGPAGAGTATREEGEYTITIRMVGGEGSEEAKKLKDDIFDNIRKLSEAITGHRTAY